MKTVHVQGFTWTVAALAIGLSCGQMLGQAFSPRDEREPASVVTYRGSTLIEIGCALRNTGAGWYVIDDAAHHPVNCTGVIQHPTHLELLHPVGATEVITLAVTVDEAYAKAALRTGASAGLEHSYIYLYRGIPDSAPRDPATIKTPTGNLWIQGWMRP